MDDYIGTIKLFAGNFAPQGFLLCNGQTLQVRQYQALFAVIGNKYGGDGINTFNVPDLRDKVVVGVTDNSMLNTQAGTLQQPLSAQGILTAQNLPSHTHPLLSAAINVNKSAGTTTDPTGQFLCNSGSNDLVYNQSTADQKMSPNAMTITVGNSNINPAPFTVSGNIATLQATIGLNFIILWNGDMPPKPENEG